jgi:hypothetical protein
LTENLISKYQGKLTGVTVSKEKNRSAYASAVFYEKFYRQYDNSIEMEHILLQSRKKLQILK